MFTAIGVIILIVLIITVSRLSGRVSKLEALLKTGTQPVQQKSPAQPATTSPMYSSQPLVQPVTNAAIAVSKPVKNGPTAGERFGAWLKEDWLLKVGALLLIIGFGWLTTYAFLNNWIGPMGRIALGIIAGSAFIVLGWWRIQRFIHQGGIFLVLGSTIILLTVFAAREIYDFFNPLTALGIMFLSVAFVAFASVKYNNKALSICSLILAAVAPLLTNNPGDYVSTFAYLFVIILGAIWIVALTGQRELVLASLIAISFYSIPHLIGFASSDRGVLLMFAYAFSALFFLTSCVGLLKTQGKTSISDLLSAGGTGVFLLTWIEIAAKPEWQSLIIVAWMIVFAIGAFMIYKRTGKKEPFYVYAGVSVAFLGAATAAELEGAALTIAYTIEATCMSLITYGVFRNINLAQRMSLLLAIPVILSFESFSEYYYSNSVINEHFFVLFLLAIVFFLLAYFIRDHFKSSMTNDSGVIVSIYNVAGSFYAFSLIWLALHEGMRNEDTATMLSLLVYTIVGLVTYFNGLTQDKKGMKVYGGILLGIVIARLLFVDVWDMALSGRIITFFVIGALLISTAFIGKRMKREKVQATGSPINVPPNNSMPNNLPQ